MSLNPIMGPNEIGQYWWSKGNRETSNAQERVTVSKDDQLTTMPYLFTLCRLKDSYFTSEASRITTAGIIVDQLHIYKISC